MTICCLICYPVIIHNYQGSANFLQFSELTAAKNPNLQGIGPRDFVISVARLTNSDNER